MLSWESGKIPRAMVEVTADTLIEDIVAKRPDLVGLLAKLGVVCVKCSDPYWGTLGEYCRSKGLEVDSILREINSLSKEG